MWSVVPFLARRKSDVVHAFTKERGGPTVNTTHLQEIARTFTRCGFSCVDVDPFKKLVRVRQAVWRGKVQTPKTKNAIRDIPIPVEIVDALRVHIGSREEGFVFVTKSGRPWNADLVLKRHLHGKLKVVNGNVHTLRHTFATRQHNAGVPVSVVSRILEHGSISTTLNIYTHAFAKHMEQFERQHARILGAYRAPDVSAVAEEAQVA